MIAEKENFANACGCGGYAGFDGTQDVETGVSEYLDFDGSDVESGDFDEFLGKKAKERRASTSSSPMSRKKDLSDDRGLLSDRRKSPRVMLLDEMQRRARFMIKDLMKTGLNKKQAALEAKKQSKEWAKENGKDYLLSLGYTEEQIERSLNSGINIFKSFDGIDVEEGVSYLDFDGSDVENGDFEEFVGKWKERRAIVKDLKAQGVSGKDARKQAREKVGGTSLKDIIAGVKDKVGAIRDNMGSGEATTRSTTAATETEEDKSASAGAGTGGDGAGSGSESPAWQRYAIWGGVALLVAGIGFIAYKKFAKK